MRSTGQIGPRRTVPRTPDLYGAIVVGHGVNSQFGPVRLTYEPSGQSFASMVHAFPPPVVVVAVAVGHSANSQFGPVLPTAEPSGQSFASCVHAAGPGAFATRAFTAHRPPSTTSTIAPMIAYLFIPLEIGHGPNIRSRGAYVIISCKNDLPKVQEFVSVISNGIHALSIYLGMEVCSVRCHLADL